MSTQNQNTSLVIGCIIQAWGTVVALQGAEPRVSWEDASTLPVCVVREIPAELLTASGRWSPEQWRDHFSVHTVVGSEVTATSLWGEYSVRGREWLFEPRFALRPGVTYEVRVRWPNAGTVPAEWRIRRVIPAAASDPTRLAAIYPSGNELPENLLKFYLHFTGPMSREEVYRRVRLVDDQGKPVARPFLELSQELWSPDGLRLTLYFDPGRIKRGLKPREFLGPALREGQKYTLVVDRDWPDASGKPLAASMSKEFRVVEPDESQPNPQRWQLSCPLVGTRNPLKVTFDESLDAGMLVRVLRVLDSAGGEVTGAIELAAREREWQFRPTVPWPAGKYQLVVSTTLEDLAGNSVGRLFEVDVFRPASPQVESETVGIPFAVQ